MYNEDMHELYHVTWRPQSTLQHPLENPLHPAPTPHASALEYLSKVKTPSKPAGAYRPPGARGSATPLAFKREDQGGAAYIREMMSGKDEQPNGFGKARRREVPGAETAESGTPGAAAATPAGADDENLSKAALKNKKKREAKKAKEAEAKSSGLTAPGSNGADGASPDRRDRPRSRSKGGYESPRPASGRRDGSRQRTGPPPVNTNGTPTKQPQANGRAKAAAPAPAPPAPELTVTSPVAGSADEKKIRSLLKKLRAIDDLKMRQAGGEKLEGTQVLKIGTEEGVRKELSGLGYTE